MHREITTLWGEKVVLRETPRAVTPFGGLSVFIEFLQKIGYVCAPHAHTSPCFQSLRALSKKC